MRNWFRGMAIAAAVALAGTGAADAAQPAPQAAAAPAGAVNTAPTSADAPATANPASPELAMDGAPPMTVKPMIGQPTDGLFGLQPQVTANGRRAHNFHDYILFPVITAISLLVLFLLIWVVFRYRAAKNPVASRTSHNTTIEVLWTLLPVVILALIAIPSIGLLAAQYKPAPAGAVTLKAIGNQWYWSYQYPDNGGFEITANMLKERDQVGPGERFRTAADGPRLLAADNRVVLPVGVPIRLITTSQDVIHSWAMPAFWIKLDAVPGRLNETSFTIEKPGLYFRPVFGTMRRASRLHADSGRGGPARRVRRLGPRQGRHHARSRPSLRQGDSAAGRRRFRHQGRDDQRRRQRDRPDRERHRRSANLHSGCHRQSGRHRQRWTLR